MPIVGQRGEYAMSGRGMGDILIRASDDIWPETSDP